MTATREQAATAKSAVAAALAGHDVSVGLHVEPDGGYGVRVNVASEVVASAVQTLLGRQVNGVPVHVVTVGQIRLR